MTLLREVACYILTPKEVPSRVEAVVRGGNLPSSHPLHGNHRSISGRGR